ncbi:MAG: hypothetical protein Q6363_004290 [Candidatus Njordarchaeota archaeon]
MEFLFRVGIRSIGWDKDVDLGCVGRVFVLFGSVEEAKFLLFKTWLLYVLEKAKNSEKALYFLQALAIYSSLAYIVFVDKNKKEFIFGNPEEVVQFYESVFEKIDSKKF